eukprot:2183558-Pyramimonas_sp.AAC.1
MTCSGRNLVLYLDFSTHALALGATYLSPTAPAAEKGEQRRQVRDLTRSEGEEWECPLLWTGDWNAHCG